jgi:hypothetical protein
MPSPLVVVQNNFVTKLTEPVAKATHQLNIPLWDVSSGESVAQKPLPLGEAWSPILVFGSIVFVQQWVDARPELARWMFWTDKHYDAYLWTEKLGDAFLNAHGYSSTVGDFIASSSGAMHIRPRSEIKMVGDKARTESSTGQESVAGFVATPNQVKDRTIDPATVIWVSSPKVIQAEFRVWMIGGRVAAISSYRIQGKPIMVTEGKLIDEIMRYARYLHNFRFHPDRHYVVDIAVCEDDELRVVEYNPIHSSGWYGANPINVIASFVEHEKKLVK